MITTYMNGKLLLSGASAACDIYPWVMIVLRSNGFPDLPIRSSEDSYIPEVQLELIFPRTTAKEGSSRPG